MIEPAEQQKIAEVLGDPTIHLQSITGGDISDAFLLKGSKRNYFLKINRKQNAEALFQTEAKGLTLLTPHCNTPELIKQGTFQNKKGAFLILEFIEPGKKDNDFWISFGRALAKLHQVSALQFGLDHENFIGRLAQLNNYTNTWAEFYATQRLIPQVKMAFDNNTLPATLLSHFDKLYNKLENLCPIEKPSLTHGDLWSGNFIASKNQQAFFIDPSVSFAHREMDLAMTKLFGGFKEPFYESYNNAFTLEQNFEERVSLYQLYYLLVHLNMFGTSYLGSVKQVLLKYV
ncbi:MAG: fructosamine kinase family protein [Saprospiraceae bacterium]